MVKVVAAMLVDWLQFVRIVVVCSAVISIERSKTSTSCNMLDVLSIVVEKSASWNY